MIRVDLIQLLKRPFGWWRRLVWNLQTDYAKVHFRENFDALVLGHTHEPMLYQTDFGVDIANCGDWKNHTSYVTIDDGRIELHTA
jgi:UDP-2,3-diacylglucosamine pyrophosphatase LpxH